MNLRPRELASRTPPPPRVEWEETDCPLCGGGDRLTILEAPDATPGGSGLWFAVAQCQRCGLCFTNPRPARASLLQFYPPAYAPHQPSNPLRRPRRWPGWLTPGWFTWKVHSLRRQGEGRLLDFGCGGGRFLERMQAEGWLVTGIDVAGPTVERLRRELGLRVLHGSLPHPDLAPGSFDVVTMWHALEHVPAPRAVLSAARELLVPGGRLVVAVPNIDSLPFRLFGSAWCGLDLPRHLTHFCPATLREMIERCGFQVQGVRMLRHSSWLRNSAALSRRYFRPSPAKQLLARKVPSRLVSWYGCLTRQSDCILATAIRI